MEWLKQKVPVLVISKRMGHSDPKMTLRYLNMIAEDCREVYAQYCAPIIQSAHPRT
jgi:integrase